MLPYAQAHYELVLKLAFHERRREEFQDLFSSVMELRYPGDFLRVRPWGNHGDKKNDGYLKSTKQLFQVYAPNSMRIAAAIRKIDEDYHGALPYWQEYFSNWVFVHNAIDGLAAAVLKKLLQLDEKTDGLSVRWWGYPEIRQEVFRMSEANVALVLGPAPTLGHFIDLRYEELHDVLVAIGKREPPTDTPIRPVPPDKLTRNGLSEGTRLLLNTGMAKADFVGEFFARWPDPGLGDRIAQSFKEQYEALRDAGMTPDDIFERLYAKAVSGDYHSTKHLVASLSVLAYFFEQCDIYEAHSSEHG